MNCIKSLIICSMKTYLLNAVLVITFGLIRMRKYCMSYKLPDVVVKAMGIMTSLQELQQLR